MLQVNTRLHAQSVPNTQHHTPNRTIERNVSFAFSFAGDLESANPLILMVDTTGIEPVTPTMST